jgi:hypothetical protein
MTALLLLASLALAQDDPADTDDTGSVDTALEPVEFVDPEAPLLTEFKKGSVLVPRGALLVLPPNLELGWEEPRRFSIPDKYWLLTDPMLREAVVKAQQLEICQPALDTCTAKSLELRQEAYSALETAEGQFDSDELLISTQVQTIATQEATIFTLTTQRNTARRQRNVAWAITGGIILGASTVIVVAVAP